MKKIVVSQLDLFDETVSDSFISKVDNNKSNVFIKEYFTEYHVKVSISTSSGVLFDNYQTFDFNGLRKYLKDLFKKYRKSHKIKETDFIVDEATINKVQYKGVIYENIEKQKKDIRYYGKHTAKNKNT